MLVPPYSSSTVMPSTPRLPRLRHNSLGNSLARSMAAARGAISRAAKLATVSRRIAIVSPSPKSRPGFIIAAGLVIGFAVHGHQGLQQRGAQGLLARFHREYVRPRDNQGAAGAYHFAARDQPFAVAQRHDIH